MATKSTVLVSLATVAIILISCGGNADERKELKNLSNQKPKTEAASSSSYDSKRGEGKFNAENLKIAALDAAMASKGEVVAGTKCTSCHKTTDVKLVGPGWKGVTTRHEPFWIMNFITNPDPMIDKDPKVQAMLELCLVRMPNQNLSEDEARQVLEFMRKNDGVK